MTHRPPEYAHLVEAIVDGRSIDVVPSLDDDRTLSQLRVLLEIARVHREALTVDGVAGASVGAAPPVSLGHSTSRWAHLHLLESIGHGSSGMVYRAWDSRLAREVALKLMPAGGTSTSSTLVEARRLARIHHPHVVSVYGADQIDGRVGVWMELLRGRTLHDVVRAQGPLSAREAALLGADVCSALAAVHGAGLLHRDIKAQNVVREHGGRIVLMDLGAGREMADDPSLDLAGTPLYMAPELFVGGPATVRSDIYSLGVLLFFLTTGSVPVVASTLTEIRRAHEQGPRKSLRDLRPDLSRAFVETVDRAIGPDPADRFASAGEMERALSASMGARPVVVPASPNRSPLGRVLGRSIPAWAAIALALLGGLLVLVAENVNPFSRRVSPGVAVPAGGGTDAGVRPLSADQAKIARGFEELGSTLASRGEWDQSVPQYAEAERIYRLNTNPDAPLVGTALARLGWAQQHAGQLEAARGNYELALAKFENFDVAAWTETTLVALASLHQRAGRQQDAAEALGRALRVRARVLLGSHDDVGGLARVGVAVDRLESSLASVPLDQDGDGDWLPDALEVALGLNPRSSDGDGDGVPDGDEDVDGDGVSNWLEFGVTVDPTKMIAHFGGVDPEWLGFQQPDNRRFVGRSLTSAAAPAWKIPSTGQSIYFHPLTGAQRAAAMTRGWRFVTRGELHEGVGRVALDLSPDGPLFDLGFYQEGATGTDVRVITSVVPLTGPLESASRVGPWPLLGLDYEPSTKGAALVVNGARRPIEPYAGHNQFQDDMGFFFAASIGPGKSARSDVDFNIVRLVIR